MSRSNKTKKIYLLENRLLGALAGNAVRQSPYHRPDNLELVLDKYHELVESTFKNAPMNCAMLTDEDLDELLSLLKEIPEYNAWNERKNGNNAEYKFVSRYDNNNNPDDDFIDLDALERNIFNECVSEL